MLAFFRERLFEVLKAIAPLVGVACLLQVIVVHAPLGLFLQFLAGSMLAVVGMLLLFAGIDVGILPMGRYIGAELPRKGSLSMVVAVAFALGFVVTIAEPDVLILASQVDAASAGTIAGQPLVYVIAAGVGLLSAAALLRVVFGFPLVYLLAAVYSLVILLSLLAPAEVVPLAFDAGSVTTGVLSTPVLLALALGLSSVIAGRSPARDGFGLLGLASAGPIIAVLLLGWMSR